MSHERRPACSSTNLQTSTQSATEGARSVAEPSREKMQSSITSTLHASHRTKCLELLERDSSHTRLGKAADGGEPQALNPGCVPYLHFRQSHLLFLKGSENTYEERLDPGRTKQPEF